VAVGHKELNLHSILKWLFQREMFPWLQGRSWGFKAGVFLGALHLLMFLSNLLYMVWFNEGRWNLFWILCGYVDFPASLLLTKVLLPVLSGVAHYRDSFMSNRIPTLMIFAMFYSFVGTMWYFWLPVLIEKACSKITVTGWAAWAVSAMMVTPILAHWLQLIRFVAANNYPFVPALYSILPAVWTVLLVVLLLATRKKMVLWLLVLMPFVYYYFIRDLYYYMTLTHH
jgi:hypothetical protein